MAKKTSKKAKKAVKSSVKKFVICDDCGNKYEQGAPHREFCLARTCEECGTTYDYILNGEICDECTETLFEYEDDEFDLEDDEEI